MDMLALINSAETSSWTSIGDRSTWGGSVLCDSRFLIFSYLAMQWLTPAWDMTLSVQFFSIHNTQIGDLTQVRNVRTFGEQVVQVMWIDLLNAILVCDCSWVSNITEWCIEISCLFPSIECLSKNGLFLRWR